MDSASTQRKKVTKEILRKKFSQQVLTTEDGDGSTRQSRMTNCLLSICSTRTTRYKSSKKVAFSSCKSYVVDQNVAKFVIAWPSVIENKVGPFLRDTMH